MTEPLVSICVITYNQEGYIAQTLDSILSQEHNYPYEIVVGEDCSTDGTKKIIEEYVEKYPDIIKPLYNNPNKGIIGNYFNVISYCRGKYIMECAGDDYWLPGKVKTQVEYMETHPDVGMCYGKAFMLDVQTSIFLKREFGSKWETFPQLLQDNKVPALTVCMRKDVLSQYIKEINPLEKKWLMEDYPTWLWIAKNSKIKFLDFKFGVYRVGQVSASLDGNLEKMIRFSKNYHAIKSFYSELYCSTPLEWNEDENLFFICYDELRKDYSQEIKKKLLNHYKKISKKNLKMKVIYFSSLTKITFKLFLKFRGF